MTAAERLVLYVTRGIQDEGGFVSRTRLLKVIYLIDVEYYRRHRRTLTGWLWVFHFYGPYVHSFPQTLARLSLSLDETEERTAEGKRFYGYQATREQDIDDLVSYGDQVMIDDVVARWALEDFNLLLNYVYFHTDPMRGAERGQLLDFGRIRRVRRPADRGQLTVPPDAMDRLRGQFSQAREGREKEAAETRAHLATCPFEQDPAYLDAMGRRDGDETRRLADGSEVIVEPDPTPEP